MPRCHDQAHRRLAQRDHIAVVRDDVAFRVRRRAAALRPAHHVRPVGLRHDDACAEALLQVARAAEVIVVPVGNDHVADRGRVQGELAQAADDRALDVVVKTRVQQDDPGAGGQCPCRGGPIADEVQIVEDARRLDVQLCGRGGRGGRGGRRGGFRRRAEGAAQCGILLRAQVWRVRERRGGAGQQREDPQRQPRRPLHPVSDGLFHSFKSPSSFMQPIGELRRSHRTSALPGARRARARGCR